MRLAVPMFPVAQADPSDLPGRDDRGGGQHNDFLLGYQVEDTVGESTEQGPPHVTVDDREGMRIALDGFETLVKRLEKLVTEVVPSLSVPCEDPLGVRLRCGREAENHFLRAKELRTCDQGRAA